MVSCLLVAPQILIIIICRSVILQPCHHLLVLGNILKTWNILCVPYQFRNKNLPNFRDRYLLIFLWPSTLYIDLVIELNGLKDGLILGICVPQSLVGGIC